jgi:hypothetical protein
VKIPATGYRKLKEIFSTTFERDAENGRGIQSRFEKFSSLRDFSPPQTHEIFHQYRGFSPVEREIEED